MWEQLYSASSPPELTGVRGHRAPQDGLQAAGLRFVRSLPLSSSEGRRIRTARKVYLFVTLRAGRGCRESHRRALRRVACPRGH